MTPKEHPTFQRAMGLAHRRLMEQRDKLSERVDQLISERSIDSKEASSVALAELAQTAYEEAVEQLQSECARIARIEYSMSGGAFLDDAILQISSRDDEAANLVAQAMRLAKSGMPEQVLTVHEFGLREDGLIFGRTRNSAIGGSFSSLQIEIQKALDASALKQAKIKILEDGAPSQLVEALAPRMLKGMRPALRAIAEKSFPSESSAENGRPLCCFAQDLGAKLARIQSATINFDNEARHTITGKQASARLLKLSKEASAERPDAAAISNFFLKLGV